MLEFVLDLLYFEIADLLSRIFELVLIEHVVIVVVVDAVVVGPGSNFFLLLNCLCTSKFQIFCWFVPNQGHCPRKNA